MLGTKLGSSARVTVLLTIEIFLQNSNDHSGTNPAPWDLSLDLLMISGLHSLAVDLLLEVPPGHLVPH